MLGCLYMEGVSEVCGWVGVLWLYRWLQGIHAFDDLVERPVHTHVWDDHNLKVVWVVLGRDVFLEPIRLGFVADRASDSIALLEQCVNDT